MQARSRAREVWPGGAFIVATLVLLELAAKRQWIDAILVPPPTRVAVVLGHLIANGEITRPLLVTLGHLSTGFIIGAVPAVALGVVMGYSSRAYRLFEPLIELLRPLPKPALVPALILFLGVGSAMKYVSVGLVVFFPILLNTISGVRSVDGTLLDTARTLRIGHRNTLWKIILPSAMPSIFAGLRISLGLGLVLAVLSEMLAGNDGLGYLIVDMQRRFQLRQMYAWLVVLALLGILLNALFDWLERRSLRGHPRSERGLWSA